MSQEKGEYRAEKGLRVWLPREKLLGTAFNAELARLEEANRTIRRETNRIIDGDLDRTTTALLLVKIVNANAEAIAAASEIREIARNA